MRERALRRSTLPLSAMSFMNSRLASCISAFAVLRCLSVPSVRPRGFGALRPAGEARRLRRLRLPGLDMRIQDVPRTLPKRCRDGEQVGQGRRRVNASLATVFRADHAETPNLHQWMRATAEPKALGQPHVGVVIFRWMWNLREQPDRLFLAIATIVTSTTSGVLSLGNGNRRSFVSRDWV
jgi:hypothetical protein